MKFDVVILGGGFAGAYCARALARQLGAAVRARVALVAEEKVLTFPPMLPEMAHDLSREAAGPLAGVAGDGGLDAGDLFCPRREPAPLSTRIASAPTDALLVRGFALNLLRFQTPSVTHPH